MSNLLSANSLIHLTNSMESLRGILNGYFKVKYCVEKIHTKSGSINGAYPMVCFSDIPISQINNHVDSYGEYGIGMKKDWAISKGLNPVFYVEKNSDLASYVRKVLPKYLSKEPTKFDEQEKELFEMVRYMKNYQNDLIRGERIIKNYRFYNEREWRFVPSFEIAQQYVNIKNYNTDEKKEIANSSIKDLKLEFEPNDIKYLIVPTENDILEVIEILRKILGNKFPLDEIEKLYTRIITVEQIREDI